MSEGMPLLDRLFDAQVASCSCMTKTPDMQYHDPMCRSRLFFEAYQMLSGHAATLERQAASYRMGLDATTAVSSAQLAEAKRLRAESSPEILDSERAANARLTDENERLRIELERTSERLTNWHSWTQGHVWIRSEEYEELCQIKRLHGPRPLDETEDLGIEAWLFHCWKPGTSMTFASIDKETSQWWPKDQWKGVIRTALVKSNPRELLYGEVPHSARYDDDD